MTFANFEEASQKHLSKIEDFFNTFWKKYGVTADCIDHFCAEMAQYQLATGGKRIRALIPLYIYDVFERDPRAAIPLGAAVEFIHNATLVHDDIQDGDLVRRGKPTVWKKYSLPQAINSGDALFFFALQALESLEVDPIRKQKIIALLSRCTLDVIEGQAQEFLMKAETFPSIKRYLQVISGKTSGLFRLPIVASMLALGADSDQMAIAQKVADDLGMLFQIQDDLLDVYGQKQRDQNATDIAEGKVSFLVAHVNEHGSSDDRTIMDRILRTPREETTRAQIDQAIRIFETYQAREAALAYMGKIKNGLFSSSAVASSPQMNSIALHLSNHFLSLI